jgi:hypothetical protein
MHLSGGWRLSTARVPIPPVPWSVPERLEEMAQAGVLLSDLHGDPVYTIDYPEWDDYR